MTQPRKDQAASVADDREHHPSERRSAEDRQPVEDAGGTAECAPLSEEVRRAFDESWAAHGASYRYLVEHCGSRKGRDGVERDELDALIAKRAAQNPAMPAMVEDERRKRAIEREH